MKTNLRALTFMGNFFPISIFGTPAKAELKRFSNPLPPNFPMQPTNLISQCIPPSLGTKFTHLNKVAGLQSLWLSTVQLPMSQSQLKSLQFVLLLYCCFISWFTI